MQGSSQKKIKEWVVVLRSKIVVVLKHSLDHIKEYLPRKRGDALARSLVYNKLLHIEQIYVGSCRGCCHHCCCHHCCCCCCCCSYVAQGNRRCWSWWCSKLSRCMDSCSKTWNKTPPPSSGPSSELCSLIHPVMD